MSISPIPIIHGCWADLFGLSQFRSPRRRFYGPGTWDRVRAHGPDWGWRAVIRPSPSQSLQIIMCNISPDGQEYLAVEADYSPV